jgi:hypothetical protein
VKNKLRYQSRLKPALCHKGYNRLERGGPVLTKTLASHRLHDRAPVGGGCLAGEQDVVAADGGEDARWASRMCLASLGHRPPILALVTIRATSAGKMTRGLSPSAPLRVDHATIVSNDLGLRLRAPPSQGIRMSGT